MSWRLLNWRQAAADALRLERQVLVGEKATVVAALEALRQEHDSLQADLRRFQVRRFVGPFRFRPF